MQVDELDSKQQPPKEKIGVLGKWKTIKCPGFGLLCAVIACGFFAVSSGFVKLIDGVDGIQLGLSRCAVQFLILLPLITHKRKEVDILGPVGMRKILWLRGFVGSFGVLFLYLSIKRMDVGDAVTIGYTSMTMLPFFARVILKEKLTVLEIVLAVVSLTGVVLIARPAFIFSSLNLNPVDALGLAFGLLGAASQALSMILIKKLGKTDIGLNVLYYSVAGSFVTFPLLVFLQRFRYPCRDDLIWVFLLGIFGVCGQYFLALSLWYERAGTVGVTRSVQVIMAYLFQVS